MRALNVAIYFPTHSAVIPMHLRHEQGVREWLKTQPIDPELAEDMVQSLLRQAEDPNKFPNIFVCLDANNKPISLEEAIPRCKRCEDWCGGKCTAGNWRIVSA